MTKDQIAKIVGDAVGNPSSGTVAEVLPAIVDAINDALNPKAKVEKRVVEPDETR